MYEKPLKPIQFDGFDSNNTWEKLWDCAEEARDEYFEGHGLHYGSFDESSALEVIVSNACEGKFMFQKDALELIAYYDTFGAAFGMDYELSPRHRFEEDVFELAEELIYKTINA